MVFTATLWPSLLQYVVRACAQPSSTQHHVELLGTAVRHGCLRQPGCTEAGGMQSWLQSVACPNVRCIVAGAKALCESL